MMGAVTVDFAAVELAADNRTVRGLAVPYGVPTVDHRRLTFAAGSLAWDRPLVKLGHGPDSDPVAVADLAEVERGLQLTADIAPTTRGDDLLALVDAGVVTGLSVEVEGLVRDGRRVTAGRVSAVAAVAAPAFTDAVLMAAQRPPRSTLRMVSAWAS